METVAVKESVLPNRILLGTGALTFAAAYVPSVIVASNSERTGDNKLYIPLVGPWMDLADRPGCGSGTINCGRENVNIAMLIVDGVAQAAGAAQLLAAFLAPEHHNVLQMRATAGVHVAPTQMGRGGVGLAAVGAF